MTTRRVGVEEELLLVDPATGSVMPRAADVLRQGEFEAEIMREQVEVQTPPLVSLADLRESLVVNRKAVGAAAATAGVAVAALATSPMVAHPSTSGQGRYLEMTASYGLTAREQLTCGCHVHVEVDSREEGVAVIDRIRPWLSVLLALSCNSPFWQGEDTGYASYRGRVWGRWPSSGPTELFGSAAAYDETVESLVATGVLMDKKMAYFDARVSEANPTVEIRVADVCRWVDQPVLLAALGRALVETAALEWQHGVPPVPARIEMLRVASWRAARSGLSGELVDVHAGGVPRPARQVVGALLAHVRPALERWAEWEEMSALATSLLDRGTGASAQRAVHARTGSLADVARDAVLATQLS